MKIIETVLAIFCFTFALWLCLSWGEVIAKNNTPNPQYNEANFFVCVPEYFEAKGWVIEK